MNILDIDKLKNNDYVVLLPKIDIDIKESVEYTFKNVFYLDYELTKEHAKVLIDYVNNNSKGLILFSYDPFYRWVLPHIRKKKQVKWVFKNSMAYMTQAQVRETFTNIMEFYDRSIVNTIGCLYGSTYKVLKNAGYNAMLLRLDIERKKTKVNKSNSIGILGDDFNPNHNTYNQLSALKMVDYSYIKMIRYMPATEHFIKFFGIKEKTVNNINDVIKNNFVNLYACFTATNYELFLKSMDQGVPCLLGNTSMLDKYPVLKKYLTLESDDDINEIANKINGIKENKELILKEYDKYRKNYSKKSKELLNKFLK